MKEEVRLGLLGGSGIYDVAFFERFETRNVDTPYGRPSNPLKIGRFGKQKVAFLSRHGKGHEIPAHQLPHKANLWAFKELGVQKVVSTSSVGSLKKDIRPGSFLVPDDFFSPWNILTYFDSRVKHITPSFNEELRRGLIQAGKKLKLTVHGNGTYVQTIGPRLETRAEIRALSTYGEVVGMTVASEATLANELDLGYASLCMVDNYCHGIEEEPLTYEKIVQNQKKNARNAKELISKFVGETA
ncbi:MAG: MTAP family purine nucleoside phosphorylase [Methanobacteriota archaeon]|nr:MAG: MTAP family purine nucleoside phosphorylase [Euryarchaeota archaeon]